MTDQEEKRLNDRYREVCKRYYQLFGEYFPRMQILCTTEECIKRVEMCIYRKKPAQEIWPLPDNPDLLF